MKANSRLAGLKDKGSATADGGTEISGTLGFAMLWILDIKIDYRDHLIGFQVDPKGIIIV